MVAQDFIYSWKRLADAENQSEGYWVFDGKIKGLNEWRDGRAKKTVGFEAPIEGLKAPDDHTLVITLNKPYFQLIYQLTSPYTAVVPHEAIDKYGKEFLNHAVGTGPFVLDEWIRNSRLSFSKNPTWHGETYPSEGEASDQTNGNLADAGKALPFVDKVVYNEVIESQPAWLNFLKGSLDYIEIPKDNFDSALKDGKLTAEFTSKRIELLIVPDPDLTYTGFNMMDPILGKNANLRKAMSLAIDDDTLLKKFYNGRGISAQSPIPPGLEGYDPGFKNPYKEYSIAKAKEFLAKAGYPGGKGLPEFEYSIMSSTTERQMGEFLQQQLEKIGVKIRIAMTSWPQFTEKLKDKKAQMFGIAWSADYPDAENFLQLLYRSE